MLKVVRFLELMWFMIGILCIAMAVYKYFTTTKDHVYFFLAFSGFSFFLFFLRKRQRKRMQKEQNEK